MIDVNVVKKELYKSKAMAKFSHYVSGNIYYKVELEDGTYQFPISTVDRIKFGSEEDSHQDSYKLSSDLGTTPFYSEMKGLYLNRWISKVIDSGEFIKVS